MSKEAIGTTFMETFKGQAETFVKWIGAATTILKSNKQFAKTSEKIVKQLEDN